MKLIAAAMDEENRAAIREAARRSPGENIEIALALSKSWSQLGRDLGRGACREEWEGISFVRLWREAQERKARRR